MKVTLLSHTPDPEFFIGKMAAECYDSKTDRESCIRRAKHCVASSHLATLRFASATVHIEGISRICSHQLVRVAHAGILQRSQRYVAESSVQFIDPPALHTLPAEIVARWFEVQDQAELLYLELIETKQLKKEDARYILPQSCQTAMNVTMNFQGWRDWLGNRTSSHAQWEIRAVAVEVQRLLSGIAPNIFPLPYSNPI